MALQSAYDDLRLRTLAKIEGTWGKLNYLAKLRSPEGRYEHWGFERAHGSSSAQQAFASVHEDLAGTILRSKLSALREDLDHSSEAAGISPISYASSLGERLGQVVPADFPKWSELHLLSVLKTLSILQVRPTAGPQSASRRPPLAR